jgi:hypothetical protein
MRTYWNFHGTAHSTHLCTPLHRPFYFAQPCPLSVLTGIRRPSKWESVLNTPDPNNMPAAQTRRLFFPTVPLHTSSSRTTWIRVAVPFTRKREISPVLCPALSLTAPLSARPGRNPSFADRHNQALFSHDSRPSSRSKLPPSATSRRKLGLRLFLTLLPFG